MTQLEREIFQCQKIDLLGFLTLPFLKLVPQVFGGGYLKTYLTFSGKIVVAASTVNNDFKFYLHQDYLLSFQEEGKTYIVFNHPKQYESAIISIMDGSYSKLELSTILYIRDHSSLVEDVPVYGGGKYTHPIMGALRQKDFVKDTLKEHKLDYKGELLPPLNLYEDLIDLDTVII